MYIFSSLSNGLLIEQIKIINSEEGIKALSSFPAADMKKPFLCYEVYIPNGPQ